MFNFFKSISPGAVDTDIFHAGKFIPEDVRIKKFVPALDSSDISGAMFYLLQLPYHVNVSELSMQVVGEIFFLEI